MDELIPIDEVILVKEASLDVPYHDIKTAYDYMKHHAELSAFTTAMDYPRVSELLKRWEEFLAENY